MSTTAARFRDATLPLHERVEDLLAQMTLDEKLAQLGCLWSTALVQRDSFDEEFAAAQMPHGIGQVTRIGASTGLRPRESAALMNAIQRVAVERTRLGIPIFVHATPPSSPTAWAWRPPGTRRWSRRWPG
jgi:beta-glucosidase